MNSDFTTETNVQYQHTFHRKGGNMDETWTWWEGTKLCHSLNASRWWTCPKFWHNSNSMSELEWELNLKAITERGKTPEILTNLLSDLLKGDYILHPATALQFLFKPILARRLIRTEGMSSLNGFGLSGVHLRVWEVRRKGGQILGRDWCPPNPNPFPGLICLRWSIWICTSDTAGAGVSWPIVVVWVHLGKWTNVPVF